MDIMLSSVSFFSFLVHFLELFCTLNSMKFDFTYINGVMTIFSFFLWNFSNIKKVV